MPPNLPAVGQTISAQQFNALNTAATPPQTQPVAGGLPPVGQKVSAEQFAALQKNEGDMNKSKVAAPLLKGVNDLGNTLVEAGNKYKSGLVKTYAGSVGLNSETGQWEMPDFLKEAGSSKSSNPLVAVGEGAIRSGASLINTIFAPITQAISSSAEAMSDNPNVQKLAGGALRKLSDAGQAIENVRSAHPEIAKDIDSALSFLLTAGSHASLDAPISFAKPNPMGNTFEEGGATHNTLSTYDNYIKSGDYQPEAVYSDVANKIYQPEVARQVISDTAGQFKLRGYPDAATKLSSMLDENNLTADQVLQAGHQLSQEINTGGAIIPKQAPGASETPTAIPPEEVAGKLKAVADDWAKPTLENVSSYNKARAVLEKNPKVPQFLAEQGLNPFSHIEDGKYEVSDSAQSLRETAGKMSEDTFIPSLKQADYGVEPIQVEDLTSNAKARLQSEYSVTADDAETISTKIDSKIAALDRKYPNGMSLVEQETEKINYAKNGGYSPVKDPSVNNNAIANRAMADSLDKSLQANVPEEIGYKSFKTYLSNYYKAADYLDTLQGKKAPVSFGQMVARNVAKFTGAKLGGMFGGDIVSEFAGYQIGKALEHAIENLTNPLRDSFLKNLQQSNPEAFSRIQDFLSREEAAQITRPRLTAGKPSGSAENPIIMSAPQPKSSFNTVDAKAISIQNPKTGRFDKAYTSEPKTSADMIQAKYDYDPVTKTYKLK